MSHDSTIYKNINEISDKLKSIKTQMLKPSGRYTGLCGFDGFVDSFIRMEDPSSMESFGPRVAQAAGIAASFRVKNKGDKFGGNGPLFAGALSDIFQREIDLTYAGGIGDGSVEPIFQNALEDKVDKMYPLAKSAHSNCLEFTDGKVMLNDLSSCADITWDRLIEVMGADELDNLLLNTDCIGAVNWGKLEYVGEIWKNLAVRLGELNVPAKKVHFFMDLAEFEQRSTEDVEELLETLKIITKQATTMLSFNLKEAWEMGEFLKGDFRGKKTPVDVARLAAHIRENVDVDKVIIHPNDGAVCAGKDETVYVPGPFCKEPLISTGAGDNFGAGCLAASLKGLDDLGIILAGVCTSGHFVRSGKSPSFGDMVSLLDAWERGDLAERL